MKATYNADQGQYVLQILNMNGRWEDYYTIKSQSDLNSAILRAKTSRGSREKTGGFRVIHGYMGVNVIADYRYDD